MSSKDIFRIQRQVVTAAFAGMALLIVDGGSINAIYFTASAGTERQTRTMQNKFYCNIRALTPAERAHHTELTDKLMRSRREMVETEKGYEFRYGPSDVSFLELADWVVAEGKCCPFFDFHLDLEREGSLLCLRLTGEDGVKEFIRAEFHVPAK
jgi:hypothetical protein